MAEKKKPGGADRWDLALSLPGGLRLFRERGSRFDAYAVADRSGDWPEDTHDGVQWFRPSDGVFVGAEGCSIPLIAYSDGERAQALLSPRDALILACALSATLSFDDESQPPRRIIVEVAAARARRVCLRRAAGRYEPVDDDDRELLERTCGCTWVPASRLALIKSECEAAGVSVEVV